MSKLKKSTLACIASLLSVALLGCGPTKGMKKGEEGNVSKDATVTVSKSTIPVPENVKKSRDNPTGVTSGGVPKK
jgi:hypothetical protein